MRELVWLYMRCSGKRGYALVLLLAACYAAVPALSVWTQQFLVDEVWVGASAERLIPLLLLMISGMAVSDLLFSVSAYAQLRYKARVRTDLAEELLRRLYRLPMARLQRERTGKRLQNTTDDTEAAASVLALQVPEGVQTGIELAILAGIIASAEPLIVLFVAAVSPLYVLFGKRMAARRKQAAKGTKEQYASLIAVAEEGITASREIVAFHRQQWQLDRFHRAWEEYFKRILAEAKLANIQSLCADPIRSAIHLAVLGIGGLGVMRGTMSIGQLVVVYQLSGKLLNTIHHAYSFSTAFSASLAAVDRCREALEEPSGADEGIVPLIGPVAAVEFRSVSFRYDGMSEPVWNEATFSIPIGKKVAFVGASGSGKSTLIRLLLRFHEPESGAIAVNGLPLGELKRDDWLGKITVVLQDPHLFPATIRENILLGRTIAEERLTEACKAAQIHDDIFRLPDRYDTVLGERGITLSGGQRQRLAIARSLLSDADILLLDEATSALDGVTERLVRTSLDRWRKGKTTVIIAHRLQTVRHADLIYVMDRGRIVEQGTHEELISRRGIYGMQWDMGLNGPI